jgi:Shikimate dehydrogenase substrate binding domain/Putative cyclase
MGFRGLNVTHPCKQTVVAHLDALAPKAQALGAVSTVVFENGTAIGHNTDWSGLEESFARSLDGAPREHVRDRPRRRAARQSCRPRAGARRTRRPARRCLAPARAGDVLLVRTGWITVFLEDRDPERLQAAEPGQSLACAAWLADRDVAAVCADNYAVEVDPAEDPSVTLPLHCVLLRDLGMPLGEMLDLEALSRACARERRWEFLFVAVPLKVAGGLGSPVAAIAVL